jgi:hypothetical protein
MHRGQVVSNTRYDMNIIAGMVPSIRRGDSIGEHVKLPENLLSRPGARDRVFYGRERFACEKTRPLFRPLAEK